jgi:Flp pilus assembly pilin Flp
MKQRLQSKKASLGQGMTEYIIIVALIAIAAIGVFNYFGKTVRNQGAAMAQGLAGEDTKSTTDSKNAGTAAAGATAISNQNQSLKTFGSESGSK